MKLSDIIDINYWPEKGDHIGQERLRPPSSSHQIQPTVHEPASSFKPEPAFPELCGCL